MTRRRPSPAPVESTDISRAPLSSFHSVTGPGWTMYRGDCLDVLAAMPDKSVAHVITDPPYEAEAHTKGRRIHNPRTGEMRMAPLTFDAITPEQRAEAAGHIARIAQRWMLAFCQIEAVAAWREAFEAAGARYVRTLVWVKPNGQPQLTGDRPGVGYECVVVCHDPDTRLRWNAGGKRGWIIMPTDANFSRVERMHETQKPRPLIDGLVADFTDEGESVLDMYAGSATTGASCRALGRTFIGIERDPDYFEIACRRLAGDEAKPRKEQPGLFDLLGSTP